MTQEEQHLQDLLNIKAKSMVSDEDANRMWAIYNLYFPEFLGSKTCGECIRDAFKKLIDKLT